MKQHTQLRMEIHRQGGVTIEGMVSVNQEDCQLGSAGIYLKEETAGDLQTASLKIRLLQKDHWVLEGFDRVCTESEKKAPIRVYIPLDPKPEKMTALYLFCDWWTRPAFTERYEDIPPLTQVLLTKAGDTYACLVPMVGKEWKATLNGGTETELCLEVSCGVDGYMCIDEPIYVLAEGSTILEAVHRAFAWIAEEKGILLREDRRLPEQFDSLGWCSWNAFYTDVDETGLREKAAEFTEKSVPVRWMIIDDGWMSTEETYLTDYEPDKKKFPNGFLQMVKDIRQSSPVQKFGVWHALGGYWSGIRKGSPLALKEAGHLKDCVNGLLVPDPEHGADFYKHWYELLRREGIEFVKVDGQGTAARYFENTMPISSGVRGMNEALESGAVLMDNNIINCMGMPMENILARPTSAVSRNSDDFFPDREGSFAEHLLENAYNAIYHDEIHYCDWDMFWTSHPDGAKHSLLRAISGGPVYFSDRVGETNPDVLKPLAYLDGRLLRMLRSAKPTQDCVFTDPLKNGVLKIHNAAPWGADLAGGIAVFNLTQEEQQYSFSASEIPELEDAPRYWIYDWFAKKGYSISREDRFEGTCPVGGFGWYVILPERETLSCLGLTEKYAGFTAVESIIETGESTIAVLREIGTISWLADREYRSVMLGGVDVTDQVVKDGNLCTLAQDERAGKAVLQVNWQ